MKSSESQRMLNKYTMILIGLAVIIVIMFGILLVVLSTGSKADDIVVEPTSFFELTKAIGLQR
jgi:hypothetical protein